ncbi:MAG: hypothetical protein JRN52_11090, partial [Nitrososphaerota archaeon]|nr:hypothetical protein [Nitrososphaerota archaeon]
MIKTTSRNYIIRLFYYLFACLVYNAWVMYNIRASSEAENPSIAVIAMKIILLISLVQSIFYSSGEKQT